MNNMPLCGIRVLEIGAYVSAPYAGSLLCSLGAEVVKIEPAEGEPFRFGQGAKNAYFQQYNSGKKSVSANLKSADGIHAIKALLPRFDVLIQNMRPGKMSELGLGPEVCRQINPKLIYMSVSGFGSGGPRGARPAYDTMGQSLGGLYSIMNDSGNARLTGTNAADLLTGISTTMGILASLLGRERNDEHRGVSVETSLLEAVSMLTIDAMTQAFELDIDPVRQSRHPPAQNFCLQTQDGQAISVHLSVTEKFWEALARGIGREDLLEDPRFRYYAERSRTDNYRALEAILKVEFAKRTRKAWEELLLRADVPFAPVLTMREVATDPQIAWLELLEDRSNGSKLVRPPWRFDGARPVRGQSPPELGEHTGQVMREVFSDEELQALVEKRAVKVHSAADARTQATA